MAKNLSSILAQVRAVLRDEAAEGVTNDFTDDEVMAHLDQALTEISAQSPAESRETLTAVPGSRALSVAAVTGLLDVEKAEYPAGEDPPKYRNVSLFGSTLTLDVDAAPTSAATVYAYCRKAHSLSETSSTLRPTEERLLVDGTAAYTALAWAATVRAQVKSAQTSIGAAEVIVANLDATGSPLKKALADMETAMDQAEAVLNTYSSIKNYLDADANSQKTALQAMDDVIGAEGEPGKVANELKLARDKMGTALESFDKVLAGTAPNLIKIVERIKQAMDDIQDGRDLVNTITISGDAQGQHLRNAAAELQTVMADLSLARTYLNEISSTGGYLGLANREQANASIYSGQASQYNSLVGREIQLMGTYITYANEYMGRATHELQAANTYLGQAGGHLRNAASRLSSVSALNAYQSWAQNKLLLYKRELNKLARPRTRQRYPTA